MEQPCEIHAFEVDVIVQDDSAVLLVRPRTLPGGAEGWCLPGGALRFGEAPDAGARRVLRDQLALIPEWLTLAGVESDVQQGVWRLVFHFRCDADRKPVSGPDVAEARFFQIEHLPPTAHGAWERDVIYRVITAGADEP